MASGPKVIGHSNYCFTWWQVFLNTQRAPSSAIKKECSIGLGTNSTRFHVEITIRNFIYYFYLTIGGLGFWVWVLGFGGLSLRVLGVIGGLYVPLEHLLLF